MHIVVCKIPYERCGEWFNVWHDANNHQPCFQPSLSVLWEPFRSDRKIRMVGLVRLVMWRMDAAPVIQWKMPGRPSGICTSLLPLFVLCLIQQLAEAKLGSIGLLQSLASVMQKEKSSCLRDSPRSVRWTHSFLFLLRLAFSCVIFFSASSVQTRKKRNPSAWMHFALATAVGVLAFSISFVFLLCLVLNSRDVF